MCICINSYNSRDFSIFLNYVEKRQKPCGKFAKTFFVFLCRRSPKNFFLKTFFLENICAYVLSPWPLAFLSLASRGSMSSEGLSLAMDFFCVLGLCLESYVLDSTSVFCKKLYLQKNIYVYFGGCLNVF